MLVVVGWGGAVAAVAAAVRWRRVRRRLRRRRCESPLAGVQRLPKPRRRDARVVALQRVEQVR